MTYVTILMTSLSFTFFKSLDIFQYADIISFKGKKRNKMLIFEKQATKQTTQCHPKSFFFSLGVLSSFLPLLLLYSSILIIIYWKSVVCHPKPISLSEISLLTFSPRDICHLDISMWIKIIMTYTHIWDCTHTHHIYTYPESVSNKFLKQLERSPHKDEIW